jgi:hypothetical protein
LRCERLAGPLGIDRAAPRFAWIIPPGALGLAQTVFQVLIAKHRIDLRKVGAPGRLEHNGHPVRHTARVIGS